MTPQEKTVLQMLGKGLNYTQISEKLRCPMESVHTLCYRIRKQTGIKNTKDVKECSDFVFGHGDKTLLKKIKIDRTENMPTQAQIRVLELRAEGMGRVQIAERLFISKNTVANTISQGCKRARIRLEPECIKEYLSSLGVIQDVKNTMDDPFFN